MANAPDPLASAYEIAKLHAAVDGAFAEPLMQSWFQAAWALCGAYAGLILATAIEEVVHVEPDGALKLSHFPTSNVRFFAAGRLVAVLPPGSPCFLPRTEADELMGSCRMCCPNLCCYCDVKASYTAGLGTCDEIPPLVVQAVARVFAYICENRGDTELDEHVLAKCGAKAFLSPYLTYVA